MNNIMVSNYLYCPLTNLIFLDPVVAEDGYVYERMAIEYCFNNKLIVSPKTSKPISTKLIPLHTLKDYINLLDDSLKINQFMKKKPYFLFKDNFILDLQNKKYDELCKYTDIIITDYFDKATKISLAIKLLSENKDLHTLTTIIDNCIDYDTYSVDNIRLINIASIYGSQNLVRYLIDDKKIMLEYDDLSNPDYEKFFVHDIAKYFDDISNLMDLFTKENLLVKNNKGDNTAHILCKNINNIDKFNSIKKLFNIDIYESFSDSGYNCFHYACIYCGNVNIIKEFFNLNISLEKETLDGQNIHDLIYLNNLLSKQQKMEIIFEYLQLISDKSKIPLIDNYIDV